jgi:hypothetical protein
MRHDSVIEDVRAPVGGTHENDRFDSLHYRYQLDGNVANDGCSG